MAGWPSGGTLEEMVRNLQMQLDETFASHNCAKHPFAKGAAS